MNRKEILDEAKRIISGDREDNYGTPEDSFGNIAEYWSIYLGVKITPIDVAALMILLKVSRKQTGKPKDDNWVDLAGYAACGGEIEAGEVNPKPHICEELKCDNCGWIKSAHNKGFSEVCNFFTSKIDETQSMGKSS